MTADGIEALLKAFCKLLATGMQSKKRKLKR